MSRTTAIGFITAVLVTWAALEIDWDAPVPEGDYEYVSAGLAVTVPPDTTTTLPASTIPPATVPASTIPPATVPASTTLPGNWECPDAITLAVSVGWPTTELAWLDHVIRRESACNPYVHAGPEDGPKFSRDDSYGLLQINVKGSLWPDRRDLCGLPAPEALYTPSVNLTCGLRLWERSGRSPWGG